MELKAIHLLVKKLLMAMLATFSKLNYYFLFKTIFHSLGNQKFWDKLTGTVVVRTHPARNFRLILEDLEEARRVVDSTDRSAEIYLRGGFSSIRSTSLLHCSVSGMNSYPY